MVGSTHHKNMFAYSLCFQFVFKDAADIALPAAQVIDHHHGHHHHPCLLGQHGHQGVGRHLQNILKAPSIDFCVVKE